AGARQFRQSSPGAFVRFDREQRRARPRTADLVDDAPLPRGTRLCGLQEGPQGSAVAGNLVTVRLARMRDRPRQSTHPAPRRIRRGPLKTGSDEWVCGNSKPFYLDLPGIMIRLDQSAALDSREGSWRAGISARTGSGAGRTARSRRTLR